MSYLRLSWLYFRIGAMNELQYRVNFFVSLLQVLINLGTGLIALWLIFSYTKRLDGWTPYELLALMGIQTLMSGVIQTSIQPNMMRLMAEIQDGSFDYALTKPVDAQLMASVREVSIWSAVDVAIGLIVVLVAVLHLQASAGILQALGFILLLFLGALMIYSFWLILSTIAFWAVHMDELGNLFEGLFAAGRYPIDIYPAWLRYGLTFLVPVAFAVTVPAEALTGRLTAQTLLLAVIFTGVLLAIARGFWKLGLRRYSGASA